MGCLIERGESEEGQRSVLHDIEDPIQINMEPLPQPQGTPVQKGNSTYVRTTARVASASSSRVFTAAPCARCASLQS